MFLTDVSEGKRERLDPGGLASNRIDGDLIEVNEVDREHHTVVHTAQHHEYREGHQVVESQAEENPDQPQGKHQEKRRFPPDSVGLEHNERFDERAYGPTDVDHDALVPLPLAVHLVLEHDRLELGLDHDERVSMVLASHVFAAELVSKG